MMPQINDRRQPGNRTWQIAKDLSPYIFGAFAIVGAYYGTKSELAVVHAKQDAVDVRVTRVEDTTQKTLEKVSEIAGEVHVMSRAANSYQSTHP